MATLVNNRQVNVWRGSDEPPTLHHVWIKDDTTLYLYDSSYNEWVAFLEYPGITVQQLEDGSVKVSTGETGFTLATSGNALSINKIGDTITLISNALTGINTEFPLKWENGKLTHIETDVEPGEYGSLLDTQGSTFNVPNFTVNQTGHITQAKTVSVTIPDRVIQNPLPEDSEGQFPIILAGSSTDARESGEVYKKTTFNYDADKDIVNTPGLFISGDSEVHGTTTFYRDIVLGGTAVIVGSVTGTATPTNHASDDDVFGLGTKPLEEGGHKYGHVKLISNFVKDPITKDIVAPEYKDGIAATPELAYESYIASKTYADNLFGEDFKKVSGKYMIDWLEI